MRSNRLLLAGLLLTAFLWAGCTGLFHNEPAPAPGGEAVETPSAEQPAAEKPVAEQAPAEKPAKAEKPAAEKASETVAARPTERIERLPNGLWVIVRERHLGGMAAFRIYVAAGALNEAEYAGCGISHLLEHLVSGGATPTRTEDQVREALEAIGADTNAQTGKQDVCYYGQAVGAQTETLIDVIADYVMHVKIDPKSFEREHEVVTRELERGEANPDVVLWNLADETFFLSHPAHFPVIGYAEDLKRLKIEDAQKFYRRVVTPDRSVAVCVGDFDADKVFAKIRDTMGKWERQPGAPAVLPPRDVQVAPRFAGREMDVAAVRAILQWPSVQLTHPDLYPLDILAFVLGQGDASRLVADVREKRGLVQSISVASVTPAGYDGGTFLVTYQAEPAQAAAARAAILEHLYRVGKEGVTPAELARAKRQKISEHAFGLQTCEQIAEDMGSNALFAGDPHFSDQYVENIQKVSAEDVNRVAAEYLRPEMLTETVVRPKAAPAKEGLPGTEKTPPAAKPGRPQIIARVLANGTWLLLCPVEGHPTVSIQMALRGGLSVENEKNAGISHFMAGMLMKGTAKRKAEALAATLDAMGAEMSASGGYNTVTISARCLAEDFEKTFDLAAESLLAPTFPQDEIDMMRDQTLAELAQMQDTPQGEGGLFFQRSFFADSPYRFPVAGTPESVKSLKRDNLVAWHKQYVAGNNLVVAIFGGFDLVKEAHYAARAVEGLAPTPALRFPKDVPPRKGSAREVYVKPSTKESAIVYVAYPGIDVYNVRDRSAMELLDTVMGGYQMPSGWLHEELRGKGLVYEVHTIEMAGLLPGYYGAYAICQPAKVPEVVGIIEAAMKRATTEKFPETDLGPARATILTAKESGRETLDGWALESALNQALGLGYNFPQEDVQRLNQAKPEDVARVAREFLKNPVICVLTNDAAAAETIRK